MCPLNFAPVHAVTWISYVVGWRKGVEIICGGALKLGNHSPHPLPSTRSFPYPALRPSHYTKTVRQSQHHNMTVLYSGLLTLDPQLFLKGVCHEIIHPYFFHDSNEPIQAPDKQAKVFSV